ncbi:MAG: hypothetical protein LBD86_01370 [Spirochaetaceae bacterium]|jgi:hypothetical protein|nr:hypothetical protein [Spirochaetaceae bacterium]
MAFDSQKRTERAKNGGSCGYKNGWYVMDLKGSNAQIGYDHGVMLAEEIRDYIEEVHKYVWVCMGIDYQYAREDVKRLSDGKISAEMVEEMNAIATGVNNILQTSYDIWDLVLINWMEGWSGYAFDAALAYQHYSQLVENGSAHLTPPVRAHRDHCSAFVATGRYTTDGKPVMYHNSFNVFETSGYANVIATITPEKGHRFTMQTQIGYVHSMADFYIVETGKGPQDRVAITETTIGGFNRYNKDGIPEFDRIRRAVQHFTSINDEGDAASFVSIMRTGESGDYANTWLIADYRDNSIWEFEEGLEFYNVTHKPSNDEKPYFFGANYPKHPQIRNLECSNDGGDDIRRHQGARRVRLPHLVEEYGNKGDINLKTGEAIIADHYDVYDESETDGNSRTVCSHYNLDKREYMSDPSRPKPYQPRGAIDGMGVDSNLAADLRLNARWGSSCGAAWFAGEFLEKHPQFDHLRPFLHDRPSQPWTVLPEVKK